MHGKCKVRLLSNLRRAIGASLGALFNDPVALVFLFLIFALLAVSGSWIADGLFLLFFEERVSEGIIMILISITIFVIIGVVIKNVVSDVNFEVESGRPRGAKVLVLFLSPPASGDQLREIDRIQRLEDFEGRRIQWEMPVRAVKYHADSGALERIEVIVFEDANVSADVQLEKFRALVRRLFPDSNFKIHPRKVSSSEDIGEMYRVLERIFKKLGKKYRDSDIIIDVTGGKKPATIAGVLASVYHFTEIQYVSTSSKEIRSYYVEPAS